MGESTDVSKKAKMVLDKLEKCYDSNGNLNKDYYDELEKDIFDALRKRPKQETPEGTDLLQHFGKPVEQAKPEPVKPEPPQPVAQAPMEKPIASQPVAQEDLFEYGRKHPVIGPSVEKHPTNNLLNYATERMVRMIKEGEFKGELDVGDVNYILSKLKGASTPTDVFARLYTIASTPISPEASNPTKESGKPAAASKYGTRRPFQHLRNSIYAHVPMTPDIREGVMKNLESVFPAEVKTSPMMNIFNDIMKKNEGKTLREVSVAIGREMLNLIGDPAKSPTTPEESKLREDAIKINKVLWNVFGLTTYLSPSNFGKESGKIYSGLKIDPVTRKPIEKAICMSEDEQYDEIEKSMMEPHYLIVKRGK